MPNWVTGADVKCSASTIGGVNVIDVSTHEFGHATIVLDHPGAGTWLTMNDGYHQAMRTLATGDKLGVEARDWHDHPPPQDPCPPICPTGPEV